MKSIIQFLCLLMLSSSCFGQDELSVSTSIAIAQTFQTTTTEYEFVVGEYRKSTTGEIIRSEKPEREVGLVQVTSPVPIQEIKCKTASLELLERDDAKKNGTWMITKSGVHLVEIRAFGAIDRNNDGIVQFDEIYYGSQEVIVSVGNAPDEDDEDTDDEDTDDDTDEDTDDQDEDLLDPMPDVDDGLKVLMILETKDAMKYDPGQLQVLSSQIFLSWLDETVSVNSDNVPEWRQIDKDANLEDGSIDPSAPSWIAPALKRERASLPWIIIDNGKRGYEGPLPKSIDEAKVLVGEYK